MGTVVIGMDPHKRSATIEVMAADEIVLGGGRYGTDAAGYAAMFAGVRRWPAHIWAIEGCQGTAGTSRPDWPPAVSRWSMCRPSCPPARGSSRASSVTACSSAHVHGRRTAAQSNRVPSRTPRHRPPMIAAMYTVGSPMKALAWPQRRSTRARDLRDDLDARLLGAQHRDRSVPPERSRAGTSWRTGLASAPCYASVALG
jgi:hypothetical protein